MFTDGRAFGTFPFALPLVNTEGWWVTTTGRTLCSQMCWGVRLCAPGLRETRRSRRACWLPATGHGLLTYCRHFGLTHTAILAFLSIFDMICPPWAAAVQRDEGPTSLWSKALPAAGIGQGVIYSGQRLQPPSSSNRSFLLHPFLGH